MTGRTWRIGELARATKVTVRALHHYDRLGLLVPSERTGGGHRCYTGDDVQRLHAILALRGFGLGLEEIGRTLDGDGTDPRDIVRRQLAETEHHIRKANRLRVRLENVLDALEDLTEPSTAELVALIEEMVTMTEPLTPEQLRHLSEQRREHAAKLSPQEREALDRRRREAWDALSDEERDRMRRQRQAMLPDD